MLGCTVALGGGARAACMGQQVPPLPPPPAKVTQISREPPRGPPRRPRQDESNQEQPWIHPI